MLVQAFNGARDSVGGRGHSQAAVASKGTMTGGSRLLMNVKLYLLSQTIIKIPQTLGAAL